jgi:hypothetical protein
MGQQSEQSAFPAKFKVIALKWTCNDRRVLPNCLFPFAKQMGAFFTNFPPIFIILSDEIIDREPDDGKAKQDKQPCYSLRWMPIFYNENGRNLENKYD